MIKHCYGNDTETFVATSLEEAFALYLEWGKDTDIDDDHTVDEWTKLPDDMQEIIFLEDRANDDVRVPPEATVVQKDKWATTYTATYAQWAAVNEVGFLCTTEF